MIVILTLLLVLGGICPEEKKPVMLESSLDSEQGGGPASSGTFTPIDNSFRFKVDPREINKINTSDFKSIKEKINTIKDKVLDAKSRIMEVNTSSVKEKNVDVALSYLTIRHRDEMSSRFSLINLTYILDGEKIYSEYDLYKNKRDEFVIYDSMISPGHHEVIVQAIYTGNAEGVFDYLNDYRIKVRSRYSFVIKDGKKFALDCTGYETGKIFTSFRDRPALKFDTRDQNYIASKTGK
ncbi:MAG: hypothetical protein JXA66_08280 [Oligoflexia bacterium]|nr:hypothetical protein [Oligoflexia bacterium]